MLVVYRLLDLVTPKGICTPELGLRDAEIGLLEFAHDLGAILVSTLVCMPGSLLYASICHLQSMMARLTEMSDLVRLFDSERLHN